MRINYELISFNMYFKMRCFDNIQKTLVLYSFLYCFTYFDIRLFTTYKDKSTHTQTHTLTIPHLISYSHTYTLALSYLYSCIHSLTATHSHICSYNFVHTISNLNSNTIITLTSISHVLSYDF